MDYRELTCPIGKKGGEPCGAHLADISINTTGRIRLLCKHHKPSRYIYFDIVEPEPGATPKISYFTTAQKRRISYVDDWVRHEVEPDEQ